MGLRKAPPNRLKEIPVPKSTLLRERAEIEGTETRPDMFLAFLATLQQAYERERDRLEDLERQIQDYSGYSEGQLRERMAQVEILKTSILSALEKAIEEARGLAQANGVTVTAGEVGVEES